MVVRAAVSLHDGIELQHALAVWVISCELGGFRQLRCFGT